MNISAQIKQRKSDNIINNPNERTNGKSDKKSTENPIITAKALIIIPRPMVEIVVITLLE